MGLLLGPLPGLGIIGGVRVTSPGVAELKARLAILTASFDWHSRLTHFLHANKPVAGPFGQRFVSGVPKFPIDKQIRTAVDRPFVVL